ncbi:MAG TPA: MerR family transcriptional regulator [Candidatus Atribacteria bacterium]|nr:MerR family transcriptional regulator [Candidatus Atribacteria bacterium]
MRENKYITTKKLAELANENYGTIDYWTKMDILPVSYKKGRTRYYDKEISLAIIKRIRELQNEDFPIKLIRKKIQEEFKQE